MKSPKKRRKNKGWFKKGKDARRSTYRPTRDECIRGFLAALDTCMQDKDKMAWFYRHIRDWYRQQRRDNGQEKSGRYFGPTDDAPW